MKEENQDALYSFFEEKQIKANDVLFEWDHVGWLGHISAAINSVSISYYFGLNLQWEAAWMLLGEGLAFQSVFVLFC